MSSPAASPMRSWWSSTTCPPRRCWRRLA